MADFRKWLLVLAVVALVAIPVGAQTCSFGPGNPTSIRDGGLTELVGDMVLDCNNPTSTAIQTNVQIFMQNATVSNRVRTGGLVNGTPQCPFSGLSTCVTDSLLIYNDIASFAAEKPPVIGLLQPAVSGTDSPTNRTSILFPAVVFPANSTTRIRIVNVRVVAPALSSVSLGLPTQVIQSVGILGFSIQPSFEVVANVLPSLQYAVSGCSGAGSGTVSYKQCVSHNAGLAASGGSGTGSIDFNVRFTEGFGLAFKTRGTTGQNTVGVTALTNYFESGLTLQPPSGTSGYDGVVWTSYADSGTKLQANFKNIPNGVSIFVTQNPVFGAPGSNTTTLGFTAVSADSSLNVSGTATCGSTSYALMKLNSSNAAVWEVTAPGIPNVPRIVSFGVVVAFVANTSSQLPAITPADTPMTTTGQLNPVSTVAQASATAAIPRFVDKQIAGGNLSITPCATTLFYPYVTNAQTFETGIAVDNSSLDNFSGGVPLKTPTQQGNCVIYFFDGTTSAPQPFDTGTLVPGQVYANTLTNLAKGATFTRGYLIAKCNFQFAHGFAYISDTTAPGIGAGYLALVIPDNGTTSRMPDPFTVNGASSGEQLTN